jgi:hypothetical protein
LVCVIDELDAGRVFNSFHDLVDNCGLIRS